ncbi:MAG: ATP synthase F0 subunit B [Acidobacteria bacterium]|nr:ATP synthase F0 subunit B [Acidobacteriota bacterium]
MRRVRAILLAGAVCAASLSSALLASGEEGSGHGAAAEGHEKANTWLGVPMPFWQGLNLVLFLGVLVYFLRKPLSNWLAERRDGVLTAQKKAESDRVKAEQLTREIQARLAKIENEIADIRLTAEKDAVHEEANLVTQAEADAKRLVARTEADIESRMRAARAELLEYAAGLSVKTAEEILRKSLTADDQRRLAQEGLASLTGAAGERKG